jgi:tetratricopeptide (TPR) repeat protein
MADLFAIQDEIAEEVAKALAGQVLPGGRAAIVQGGTHDVTAYDAYVHGLQQSAIDSYAALGNAERAMQQALARDPNYLDAMVGLVRVWMSMAQTGKISRRTAGLRARPWLDRVARIAPDNGSLLGFRGVLAADAGDYTDARRLLAQAVARSPNDTWLRLAKADQHRFDLEPESNLAEVNAALRLDPLNGSLYFTKTHTLLTLRRADEAQRTAARGWALQPDNPNAAGAMSAVAAFRNDLAGNIRWSLVANRIDPEDHEIMGQTAPRLDDLGEPAVADAWIARSQHLAPGNLFAESSRVVLDHARGRAGEAFDGAIALIPRAAEERRTNWSVAMDAGCLASVELGRTAEMRDALVRAGLLPAHYDAAGFRALAANGTDINSQVRRLQALAPCLAEPADWDKRRGELLAAVTALKGEAWMTEPWNAVYVAFLRPDRDALVREEISDNIFIGQARREARQRWLGIADDPRIKARNAALHRLYRAQDAALPGLLAQAGLSLMPVDAARPHPPGGR